MSEVCKSEIFNFFCVFLKYLTQELCRHFDVCTVNVILTGFHVPRKPDLFQILQENLGAGKISDVFIREWEYCLTVGLPSQSYVQIHYHDYELCQNKPSYNLQHFNN